jgi:NTP pyrophosphatase (non-canonical NTP hydrolase)
MPTSLDELTKLLIAFRDEREWRQFHGFKDLLVSLNLVAQWKDEETLRCQLADPAFRDRLAEETADVLLYLLLICERAGIDLGQAAAEKIKHNAEKYPVEKAMGNARKYTEF